jgi:lipoprotein-anchoring transpeptidase ErfK/SrfK
MKISHKIVGILVIVAAPIVVSAAAAQVGVPATVTTGSSESADAQRTVAEAPLVLKAIVPARILVVQRGDSTLKTYAVAVGEDNYPTPVGTFTIKKIVWNPSWRPPPGSDWAKGKTAKGPGEPGNPMKVVKIFFQEPDYYIHGTDDVESLGSAASHGCIRMDPQDVADLAKIIMEHGGQPREENWFWRIIHSRREEKVVYLENPISLTISE